MATFWERATFPRLTIHSYCNLSLFVVLVVSHFGFKGQNLVPIVLVESVPYNC